MIWYISDARRLFGLFVTVRGAGAPGFSELADLGTRARSVDHITGLSQAGIDVKVPHMYLPLHFPCEFGWNNHAVSMVHDPVGD